MKRLFAFVLAFHVGSALASPLPMDDQFAWFKPGIAISLPPSDPAGPHTVTNPFTFTDTPGLTTVGGAANFKFNGSYTLSNGTTVTVTNATVSGGLTPVVGINSRQWLVDVNGTGTLTYITQSTQPSNAIAEAFYVKDTSTIVLGNADGATTTYRGFGYQPFPGGGFYPFLDMVPIADGTMQVCDYESVSGTPTKVCYNDVGTQSADGLATFAASGNLASGSVRLLANSTSTTSDPPTLNGGYTFTWNVAPLAGYPISLFYWHTWAAPAKNGTGTNVSTDPAGSLSMIHLLPSADSSAARAAALSYATHNLPGSGICDYDTSVDCRPPRTVSGYITPDGKLHVLAVSALPEGPTPTLMANQTISDYSATSPDNLPVSAITDGTTITGQDSGTTGGAGVYSLSTSGQTIGSALSPDAIVLTATPCVNMASSCTQTGTNSNSAAVIGACPLYTTASTYAWTPSTGGSFAIPGSLQITAGGTSGSHNYYCGLDLESTEGYAYDWSHSYTNFEYNRFSSKAVSGMLDLRTGSFIHVQQNEFYTKFTPDHFHNGGNGLNGIAVTTGTNLSHVDMTRNYIYHCSADASDYQDTTFISYVGNWMASQGWGLGAHSDDIQNNGATTNVIIQKNNFKNFGLAHAQVYKYFYQGIYSQFTQPPSDIYIQIKTGDTMDTLLIDGNVSDGGDRDWNTGAATNVTVTNNYVGRDTTYLPAGIIQPGWTASGQIWSDTGGPATGF